MNFRTLSILSGTNTCTCEGLSWPLSYGSWIYNYQCNQCLSSLMLWIQISIRARCTTLCDKVCQWLATGQWFSPGLLVSSTNKTDRHNITEILLKVALSTIKQTNKYMSCHKRNTLVKKYEMLQFNEGHNRHMTTIKGFQTVSVL
jgi:hypothetical protein